MAPEADGPRESSTLARSSSLSPLTEEQQFNCDYFAYLEQPENASRYAPALRFVADTLDARPIELLDLGCGNGALCGQLSNDFRYTGVDHSAVAIEYCARRRRQHRFVHADLANFLDEAPGETRYDAIVWCGLVFHCIRRATGERLEEPDLLRRSFDAWLKPGGLLAVVLPFAYAGREGRDLLEQAAWKLDAAKEHLSSFDEHLVFQNLSLQLGVERRIAAQQVRPAWFVPPSDTTSTIDRYSGSYLASWTLIYCSGRDR